MTSKKLLSEIEGVFKKPKKVYYFGKEKYGTPYFWPWNYIPTIIKIRVNKEKPYIRVTNKPLSINLFGNRIDVYYGTPISIKTVHWGWKDKYQTPRHEWTPSFNIYFFGLQYHWHLVSPTIESDDEFGSDLYWEMILWWLFYCDKDLDKAEEDWGWVLGDSKESTWNGEYLIK